jgi:phenylacetic acid degradation operon negative regulatory protein
MASAEPDSGQPGGPVVSRRHASGSARSLLFTVLGEFVLPTGGRAWTSAFIETLGRLGVEEKACRQALMRTAADGWLESVRVGRRTRWRLTPAAERLLTEGTDRIFSFCAIAEDWDGRWTLLLARVPETDRAGRHLLRSRLAWSGFGNCAPGLWLSPRADRVPEVQRVLAEAGVPDAQLFIAEHHGDGSLSSLVGQSWDLAQLGRRYQEFIASFRSAGGDPLTRITELVHAWRRFPFIDPELPALVLPPSWPGPRAAAVFRSRHAGWVDRAVRDWTEL